MSDIKIVKSVDELLDSTFVGKNIHLPLEGQKKIGLYGEKIPFSIMYNILGSDILQQKQTKTYLESLQKVTDVNLNFDQLINFLDKNTIDNNIEFYGLSLNDLLAYEALTQSVDDEELKPLDEFINQGFKEQAAYEMVENISLSQKRDNVLYLDDTIENIFITKLVQ